MDVNRQPVVTRQLDPRTGTWATTIDIPREATAPLLAKVLGITAVGFLVTAAGVMTAPVWSSLPGMIAVFALIFAINFTRRKNPALGLGLFYLLTYFMGWMIGPLIQHYMATIGLGVVANAAAITGIGMACMGIVSYLFNINYRAVTGIGMALLLGVILIGLVSIFFHFLSPDTYSWMILGVFTLLTVGDFARIRAGGDGQSAVSLSLSIYLDAINIFLAVLQLLSGRRRN
jgi:FtsH-binding integral membrane protein